jgi:hypothetical protein
MTALAPNVAGPIGCSQRGRGPDGLARDLRATGMPRDTVRAVLGADDPAIARRYLELHREWLRERLDEQERALDRVERVIASPNAA